MCKGRYKSTVFDCLNFPPKASENDILLLEKEYDSFCNVYAWIEAHPQHLKVKIQEIKDNFDIIFKKIGLSDDFINKLWDKHGCWKYFPSTNAITKRYRNIIIETKYTDKYEELHHLLREIDYLKRSRQENKELIKNLIENAGELMEKNDLNACLACIFKTWDWKKNF